MIQPSLDNKEKNADHAIELDKFEQKNLAIACSSPFIQHFRDITQYVADVRNPLDWFYTMLAIALGTFSATVFYDPVNELIDNGDYPEWERIPFQIGTMGTNGILNIYFVLAFIMMERVLQSPILKHLNIKSEGWGKLKHRMVLLIAFVAGIPFSILSYDSNKTFFYNLLMIPPQALIYTTLQFFGTESIYSSMQAIHKKIFGENESVYQKISRAILTDYLNRIENLEELIKQIESHDIEVQFIKDMTENIENIKNPRTYEKNNYAANLMKEIYSKPQLLEKSREKPLCYRLTTPLLKLSVSAIAAITTIGFFWNTKQNFESILNSETFAWSISIFANTILTCLVCDVSSQIVDSGADILYRMNKTPILFLEDNTQSFTARLNRAIQRATPYGMTRYPKLSITSMLFMFILSNLSYGASVDLQNVAAREFVHFMQNNQGMWVGFVQAITVLFNFFGSPILISKTSSLANKALSNESKDQCNTQILLDTLYRQHQELELAGAENVVAIFRETIKLPHIPNDTDGKDCNEYINQHKNDPSLQLLLRILKTETLREEGFIEQPQNDISLLERTFLHAILKANLITYQEKSSSNCCDCLSNTSIFFKKKVRDGNTLTIPLLEDYQGSPESKCDP